MLVMEDEVVTKNEPRNVSRVRNGYRCQNGNELTIPNGIE